MKNIKFLLLGFTFLGFLSSCDDEGYKGEEIFNDATQAPYVYIWDQNENDMQPGGNGNLFWSFELTPEPSDPNSVRLVFNSSDPKIASHDVTVGYYGGFFAPPVSEVTLTTINSFPSEVTFTKDQIATALGITVADLDAEGLVLFSGTSKDVDGNEVTWPQVLNEVFLRWERHAYWYLWVF